MLPHEKALVQRMKDRKFALVGINSDGAPEKCKEILKREGITWRNVPDGDTDGPIATKWNVQGWPTIYVLDAKGVIRYRDVRGEEMEKAIESLLEESEKTDKDARNLK